ncbi:MAG TPA: histidine phosphatase family protein [Verrucomicrobiae bacterium]|nr:histidine phosphatase family protein [Verrucomicrobiae bacterium]
MTTFFLIRHGANDFVGKSLVGRRAGVHLNEAGKAEAERLADGLAASQINLVFSSPMERCRETAEPIARRLGLQVQVLEELNEIQFGDWTGLELEGLTGSDLWRQWNTFRTGVRIPNGETIHEIQARMVRAIDMLRRKFAEQRIALVSHGDPLRSVLCFYLGMPLDFIPRLEVSPASISALEIDDWSVKVTALNAPPGSPLAAC